MISPVRLALLLGALLAPSLASADLQPPDAWITARTKIALLTGEGVVDNDIHVDTVDGVVTLHGTVHGPGVRQRAEADTRAVPGVREVRNLLQVVPSAAQDRSDVRDGDTFTRAQQHLASHPRLKGSGVKVRSVHNGVLLLSGKTDTVTAHLAAIDVARRIPGVRRVATEVQSPHPHADAVLRAGGEPNLPELSGQADPFSDPWITWSTRMKLLSDRQLPSSGIAVDTREGVVTLFGTAPSQRARQVAEAHARGVSGVRHVVNLIQVDPRLAPPVAGDADVRERVQWSLRNSPGLQGTTLSVDVQEGVVRLSGNLSAEKQRLTAVMTAGSTPGVKSVKDELVVVPNQP